jgi:U3 small nucleolar RNA-associated protein 14
MNANELAEAMEIRASIRRKATSRKSVQENANDRLADQLDQAATMLREQQRTIDGDKRLITLLYEKERQQQAEIEALKQSKSNGNNKVNLELTDEKIIEVHVNTPFIDGYLNKNLIAFARAILRKAQ